MNNKGFTLTKLIIGLAILIASGLIGGLAYAIAHFIIKFW